MSTALRMMSGMVTAQTEAHTREQQLTNGAHAELDGMVVNLELTLISIIQGVALYFLTDSSRGLIVAPQWDLLPYVIAGLFVILLWWTRAIIHTLTVIRWPIEFTHNFLYVASTLVEATMFAQMSSPANWFSIGALFSALVWILFASDLRLIRERLREPNGPATQTLLKALYREQRFHARISMPLTVLYYTISALALRLWPRTLIEGGGHLWFGLPQLLGSLAYIIYIVQFFQHISPSILAMRRERMSLFVTARSDETT